MSLGSTLIRAFVTFFALSILIVFLVQPTRSIPTLYSVAVVLAVELLSWVLAKMAVNPGLLQTALRVFLISLFDAGFIVFILSPAGTAFTFDRTFLVVWAIEIAGFIVAGILTFQNKRAKRQTRSTRR